MFYLQNAEVNEKSDLTDGELRSIVACKNLKSLSIGSAPSITNVGLGYLSASDSIRQLTIISNPQLTSDGLRTLKESNSLTKIQLWHQPENPFPASKVDALSGMPELYFHNCKFDQAVIDSLCKLRGLKKVTLTYCAITPEQDERLRTELKETEFVIYK